MDSAPDPRLAVVVLAAGSSSRLGRPKQLLPFGDGVLLDVVLDLVRGVPCAQRIVTLGGSADEVKATVDLSGFDVVMNDDFTTGCSSSISAAVEAIDPEIDGIVLLLGDQPMMRAEAIDTVVRGRGGAPIAVARYQDGVGHPFVLTRATFPALSALHGDRGVWKLIERLGTAVARVDVPGRIPADVDTEADYQALLADTTGPA